MTIVTLNTAFNNLMKVRDIIYQLENIINSQKSVYFIIKQK